MAGDKAAEEGQRVGECRQQVGVGIERLAGFEDLLPRLDELSLREFTNGGLVKGV
jgi:hypothetical protein